MNFLLNVIWVVLGGAVMALGWFVAAIVMAVTIILLPFSRSAFAIGVYSFWPFGREAVDRKILTGQDDIGTSELGFVGNVIWFCIAGWWLALGHLAAAVACAITIIGLPLAWAHIKLAGVSLAPIGLTIVDSDVAAEARRRRG